MAKAGKAKTALRLFEEYKESGAPQPGMFSPLIEAVRQAPMKKGTGQAWMEYLQPGRMVNREGIQFPIKQTEIDMINIDDIDADMGLGAFIAPNTKYTKEEIIKELSALGEYRPSMNLNIARQITNPLTGERIKAGPETVIPEAWVQGATESSGDTLHELRRLEVEATKYGQNTAGTSQLSHVSPGSTYEESITRLPGLVDESQHFARDTVSHSRSSTHPNQDVGKVRLVEEIQADVHQRAAEKIYWDPDPHDGGIVTEKALLRDLPHGETIQDYVDSGRITYEGRRGYMSASDEMDLEMIVDEMEELNAQKSAIRRGEVSDLLGGELGEGMGTAAEHAEALAIINTELEQSAKDLARVRARVSNAPFKKPQEYSALELRKQLLSAVDEDADYLALTRASDQLERYGGAGHSRRRTEGMERMYDQVYYGELRKLANRYRIPITEIEMKLGGLRSIEDADIRPEYMAARDFENATDVYDHLSAGIDEGASLNDVLRDAEGFGDWASDMQRTIENHPDVPSNSGKALIKRIQRTSERLVEALENRWEGAYTDATGGRELYLEDIPPLEQKLKTDMEDLWDRYLRDLGPSVERPKTFPALELTPEVKDLIKETGVPIAQNEEQPEGPPVMAAALGGLIRKYYEGGEVSLLETDPEKLREAYRLTELRRVQEKAEEDRKDAELRRRWEEGEPADQSTGMKYLKNTFRSLAGAVPFIDDSTRQWLADTMTHIPSGAGQMWQSLDPETGEASMVMPMIIPPSRYPGFMSQEQRDTMAELREVATEANKEFRPNIIDDTKALAALPGMFWPDTFGEPPEWAAEAMARSEQVSEDVRGDFGLPRPEGFFQGASEGLGMMLGQVPVPAAGGKTAATRLFDAAGRVMPRTAKAAKIATLPARAGLEFFNPIINPSMGNYLMGAGFAGAMTKGIDVLGGDGEPLEQQMTEQELKYQQYATDTWMELDTEGRLDLISDPEVGDAAWYYLHPEEKALFLEELKEMGYDVQEEEEEETEWAKGGYVKQLAKLKKMDDGVIDAREVFEQKMLDDAVEEAGLGELADEVPYDPYDPANIKATSTEYLPPSPEFQEWLDDFRNKLDIKEAEHKEVMSTMDFKYKPGDVVRGQIPNSRYEVLFQDFNRKTGRAKYRVINNATGDEFDLPDFGIEGRAGPDEHFSTGMDELAADAAEDFEEFTGFYPEDLELGEYLGRDNFEGKAFMEDGSEVRFTYDLRETDPRNRFEVKEDAE